MISEKTSEKSVWRIILIKMLFSFFLSYSSDVLSRLTSESQRAIPKILFRPIYSAQFHGTVYLTFVITAAEIAHSCTNYYFEIQWTVRRNYMRFELMLQFSGTNNAQQRKLKHLINNCNDEQSMNQSNYYSFINEHKLLNIF